jgi:CBS domain containing-hemolysin-like protein
MTGTPIYLAAVIVLIALNGFFVAGEIALVSIRRTRVQELAEEGEKRAILVAHAVDDINRFISTIQVGVTMCSLAIGWLGEPLVARLLDSPLSGAGLSKEAIHGVAFVVAFLVITYLHVVFGELGPKYMALQSSERVALVVIRPLDLLRRLLTPLVAVLNRSSLLFFRMLGIKPVGGLHMIHSEEELKMLVSQSSRGGVLQDSEQEMLYNVFDFADTSVAEVMVPRPDVVAFEVSTPPAELLQRIVSQPYTRYPVYREDMDDIVGILHVRDLFNAAEQHGKANVALEPLLRPVHIVPESKSLAGLLGDFRRSKSHMALVVDEYGSLAGIVTLEDLIEEIVGEIDDEHDRPEQPVERISDNHIRVDGKFAIDELNERFGLHLPTDDYHTVGGFVFGELGQQPHEGDVVRHGHVRLEVTETDGPRIVHVDVILLEKRKPEGEGAEGAREPSDSTHEPSMNGHGLRSHEEARHAGE